MIEKNYRLTLGLSAKIDTTVKSVNKQLNLEHTRIFIKAFSENSSEILEYYKRYIADLYGSETGEVFQQFSTHLEAKDETDNFRAAAAACPPETAKYILRLIDLPKSEIKAMDQEDKERYFHNKELFYNFIMTCFRAPRVISASLVDVTGGEEKVIIQNMGRIPLEK